MLQIGRMIWAAVALLLTSAPTIAAESTYRLLTLNGGFVRWFPRMGEQAPIVRFAIATAELRTAGAINCGAMGPPDTLLRATALSPASFRDAVAEAFARWQSVIDVDFIEVGSTADADIVIGEQLAPVGFAFTNVTFDGKSPARAVSDGKPIRAIERALICLNPQRRWKTGFDGNLDIYDITHTLTHEIGHALGLDHPTDRNALMSFRYHEQVPRLAIGDVRGAIAIYGARSRPAASKRPATIAASSGAIVGPDMGLD